jgi:ABC-2 type transport system permease protein
VIPFFGKGLPIEYELTRSVQTVASKERYKLGILTTDARLVGGRDWDIVTELKKQYDVEEVSPATEIDADRFDVLLAAMPSSLTEPEMDNLVTYVKSGKPVLIFDDPFPLVFSSAMGGVSNAPRQPKPSPGGQMGGMFGGRQPPPEPKADGGRATRLLDALGIRWTYDQVVFDTTNPHENLFRDIPAEYVFVTRGSGNDEAFNNDSPITQGLQEAVCMYAGHVEKAPGSAVDFEPLVSTGENSGVLNWEEFTREGFNPLTMSMSVSPSENPRRLIDGEIHHIAARVKSDRDNSRVNAVFVADFDMIADVFFNLRSTGMLDVEFDNVTFVLNAVDMLVGDESFIELRSRRAKLRTLTRIEERTREFLEEASQAEKAADAEADDELEQRREQLKSRVEEIEKNENLDELAKVQLMKQAQEAEQRRFDIAEEKIEQEKQKQIQKVRANTARQQEAVRSWARAGAVLLPPIPAVLVGFVVFLRRWLREKRTVTSTRRRS